MTSLLDHQLYALSSECHITSHVEVIVAMELTFVKYSDGEDTRESCGMLWT